MDAPRILSLSANSARLLDEQPLLVTVVATDPDGVEDLIGGIVRDPESGQSYGALATSSAEGAYSLELTWASISAVRALSADFEEDAHLTFEVVLFDQAGNEVQEALEVAFACEHEQICGGACERPEWWSCGSCNRECPAVGGLLRACVTDEGAGCGYFWREASSAPEPNGTCRAWCGGFGLSCAPVNFLTPDRELVSCDDRATRDSCVCVQ